MPARSTVAIIENHSSYKLKLNMDSIRLDHGEWKVYPPQTIPASEGGEPGMARWENDSDGFMTGDEGRLSYIFVDKDIDIQTVKFYWDNPYAGSNAYSISSTSNVVKVSYTGGDGNNAAVTFRIDDN